MGSSTTFGNGTVEKEKVQWTRWNDGAVVTFASALVSPHKLLYVCRSGSHLHGTNTPASDLDFKGIFLPTEDSCFLGEQPDHFAYGTGKSDTKNSNEDVDFELWSVQRWMQLLEKGDSNALSVLFSMLNSSMCLFCDESMLELTENLHLMFNPNNVESFIGFAKGQVVKYGLKGNRLQVVENVLQYLKMSDEKTPFTAKTRLGDLNLDELVELCKTDVSDDKGYLGVTSSGSMTFLNILTKQYQNTLYMNTFVERMSKEYEKYGHRAHVAKNLDGSDWKALSHSMRTMFESFQMLTRGYVSYPLESASILTDIKLGLVTLEDFECSYLAIEKLVEKLAKEKPMNNGMDSVKKRKLVLNLYRKAHQDETN